LLFFEILCNQSSVTRQDTYMSEPSETPKSCPKCGAALPAEQTGGLCPRCLMAEAMEPTRLETAGGPAPEVLPPAELAPHFPNLEILEYLGRGGMGVVYKARQLSLNRLVALKLLAPERVTDAKFAERFEREARALAAMSHPNIVTIHDFGQAGGYYYLLMEYVDGVNLRQAMKAGRFTPEQALAVVPPVCEALQYAHEHGIVHRDIKPENLLLDREGRVKIADFGVAKMLGGDSSAVGMAESQPAGTPQYMAPEQKITPQQTDSRADIYSLGVVLYEMLTGELPDSRLQPPSKKVHIDVRLDDVVLRALEKEPERRYQTVGEVKADVQTIVATSGAPKSSSPSTPRLRRDPPVLSEIPRPEDDEQALVNARRLVEVPAIGLVLAGCLNLLLVIVMVGLAGVSMFHVRSFSSLVAPGPAMVMNPIASRESVLSTLIVLPLCICTFFIILGGLRMRNLRNYNLAVAASILAMITPGMLLGLPFGIWALIVLTRQEVRAAFEAGSAWRGMTPGGTQGVTPPRSGSGKAALATALAIFGVLLAFLMIAGVGLSWLTARKVERRQAFVTLTQNADDLERQKLALMEDAERQKLALMEDVRRSAEQFGQAPVAPPAVPMLSVPIEPLLPEAPALPDAPLSTPLTPLTPLTPSTPPTPLTPPTPATPYSRDDLQARLNAVRAIAGFTTKDQAAAELAKAAAAGETDIALAALNEMTAFTARDKAAAEVAKAAGNAGNGALALKALNLITAFTVKDQACYDCALALSKAGQTRDANRVAALITSFTVRDRCLAELAGQRNR
jgi:serine/threonine protein kinase